MPDYKIQVIAGDGIGSEVTACAIAVLRAAASKHGFGVEFQEHDEDPAFLIRHQSHLTAKGWAYYDRALDDFFHGRLPRG